MDYLPIVMSIAAFGTALASVLIGRLLRNFVDRMWAKFKASKEQK